MRHGWPGGLTHCEYECHATGWLAGCLLDVSVTGLTSPVMYQHRIIQLLLLLDR